MSTYAPMVGDALRAVPGLVSPAGAAVHFRWSRAASGGAFEVLAGETGESLSSALLIDGAQLQVEAWVSAGGVDSPVVSAGPVTVGPRVNRWRPLVPAPFDLGLEPYYDRQNGRFIEVRDVVWELTPRSDGSLGAVHVPGAGPSPDLSDLAFRGFDPVGRRLMVVTRADPTTLHTLTLSERGRERWASRTFESAVPAEWPFWYRTFYDSPRARLIVIGVLGDEAAPRPVVMSLPLRMGGEEWTVQSSAGVPLTDLLGAALTADPRSDDHMLLIGGLNALSDSAPPLNRVLRVNLSRSPFQVEALGTLPNRVAFAVAHPSGAGSRVLIRGGALSLAPSSAPMLSLDVESGEAEVLEPAPASAELAGAIVSDGERLLAVQLAGIGGVDNISELRVTSVSSEGVSQRLATWTSPARVETAQGGLMPEGLVLVGGRGADDLAWRLDLEDHTYSRFALRPDNGRAPVPAHGYSVQFSRLGDGRSDATSFAIVGGAIGGGMERAPMEVWELVAPDQWRARQLSAGEPQPLARRSHAIWYPECGTAIVGYAGGTDGPRPLAEAAELSCEGSAMCHWTAVGGAPAVNGAAATAGRGRAFLVGGFTDQGTATDIVWTLRTCHLGSAWETLPQMSEAPAPGMGPRVAHSAVLTPGASPDLAYLFVFGNGDLSRSELAVGRVDFAAPSLTWIPFQVAPGPRPRPRSEQVMAHDVQRDRLLVIGGSGDANLGGEVWELLLAAR